MSAANETGDIAKTPMLRILSGNPSDEDVAVLVAVLGSTGGTSTDGPAKPRDLWGSPTDRLRPAEPLSPTTFPNLRFGY